MRDQLARLARRFTGGRGLHDLADDGLGLGRDVPRTSAFSASLTTLSTTGRTSDETSLSFVCDENFGSGTFTDSTAVRPSRQSSPVSATFSRFENAARLGIARDLARQRAAEAGEVRAAVALRNVVGEAQHVLVVAVVPPQRGTRR